MTPPAIASLRAHIRALERPAARPGGLLPFGLPALDQALPEGGLARGALHEIAGGGASPHLAPAATLFAAGILARLEAPVLWCATTPDLFAPGLAQAGLHPDRVLHAWLPDDRSVLLAMEEALRHPGLAAVLGELDKLGMTASRRLGLAAEKSGVTALALRRPRGTADPLPTAAATRWRVTALPSAPLPSPGIGRAQWRLELLRCRGGEPRTWLVEACDAQGRLALSPLLPGRALGAAAIRAA